MSRKLWIISAIIICQPFHLFATAKRWNGSVSSLWSDLLNWTPVGVPGEADDVLLDNNYLLTDFNVIAPLTTASVHSLEIKPGVGRSIELRIPTANTSVPAMSFLASGNCLVIQAGGILRNSSGLTSGQSLTVTGKMVLFSGGSYIHNTRASHATGIVAKLSTEAGTDEGIFEFDVPGGAYALSMSNRNYGSLKISARASDNTQTYNATGSSVSNIRGNLTMEKGVTLNLDLEKSLTIGGDVKQEASVLNLAFQPNNLEFNVKGNFVQDSVSLLTETSTGQPVLVFEGNSTQHIALAGKMANSVGLVLKNSSGLVLDQDLNLAYRFRFQAGKVISGKPGLFRVGEQAVIEGASSQCFVDGPVVKLGSADFLFPVGRQIDYAPLEISHTGGSTGDVTIVAYHHGNPAATYGQQIHQSDAIRISSLEYWTVERNTSAATGVVALQIGPYSHATMLSKLVIMGWNPVEKKWMSRGNSRFEGIATGLVASERFDLDAVYTVGTTVADQNPLPVYFEELTGLLSANELMLTWRAHNQQSGDRFMVEASSDGISFSQLAVLQPGIGSEKHLFRSRWTGNGYFRVRLLNSGVKEVQSQTVYLTLLKPAERLVLYPVPAGEMLHIETVSDQTGVADVRVESLAGRRYFAGTFRTEAGKNRMQIPLTGMPAGVYLLRYASAGNTITKFFVKL